MILDTCGCFSVPKHFVNGGGSDAMILDGTLAHWGGYADCNEPRNFDCGGVARSRVISVLMSACWRSTAQVY